MKKFTEEEIITTPSLISERILFRRNYFSGAHSKPTVKDSEEGTGWVSGTVSGSYFTTIYDRDWQSVPTIKLCNITYGYSTGSAMYTGSFEGSNQKEKLRVYRLFAQKLLGNKNAVFEMNGSPRHELIFISIYRNQFKDEIWNNPELKVELANSQSFSEISISRSFEPSGTSKDFPGGEAVGLKYFLHNYDSILCFKKAGVFVIDPTRAINTSSANGNFWSGTLGYEELAKGVSGSTFNDLLWATRNRVEEIQFRNRSHVRTSFYICTAEKDEFNYSSNITYTDQFKKIYVVSGSLDNLIPTTYITTVGLYNENYELLGVAKLRRPQKKDFQNRLTITVRLLY